MSPTSAAEAFARRLLADAGATVDAAGEPADAAVRAAQELTQVLSRWFGPYGTHALLTRALAQVRPAHPVLAAVHLGAPLAPALAGVGDAVRANGPEAATEGIVAVLAATVGLLGRMIGEDMALHLVERRMEGLAPPAPPRAPDAPSTMVPPTAAPVDGETP